MITLCVLETRRKEEELFLKLLSRGEQADVPYYFSVNSYNWKEGWVIFTRLDCAPAPIFRVGVAGNQLVISRKNILEVRQWLTGWNIPFSVKEEKDCETPEEALKFLEELRKKALPKKERIIMGRKVKKAITEMNERRCAMQMLDQQHAV